MRNTLKDMAHYVASESSQRLQEGGIIPGEFVGRWTDPAPAGICHAVETDDDHTVCGIAVDELWRFEEQPWSTGLGMDRCRECRAVVPI